MQTGHGRPLMSVLMPAAKSFTSNVKKHLQAKHSFTTAGAKAHLGGE